MTIFQIPLKLQRLVLISSVVLSYSSSLMAMDEGKIEELDVLKLSKVLNKSEEKHNLSTALKESKEEHNLSIVLKKSEEKHNLSIVLKESEEEHKLQQAVDLSLQDQQPPVINENINEEDLIERTRQMSLLEELRKNQQLIEEDHKLALAIGWSEAETKENN